MPAVHEKSTIFVILARLDNITFLICHYSLSGVLTDNSRIGTYTAIFSAFLARQTIAWYLSGSFEYNRCHFFLLYGQELIIIGLWVLPST
jgi:hypothetical protein